MVPLDQERDLETLRQISHLLTRENQRLLTANLELRAELARMRGEPEVTQLAFTVEPTVSARPSVPSTPVDRLSCRSPSRRRMEGDGRSPTVVARVLDDGTTQAYRTAYNPQGEVTQATDPLGRQTTFTYAANGIDRTQIRQTTAGVNDVLATYIYDMGHRPLTVTDAARTIPMKPPMP